MQLLKWLGAAALLILIYLRFGRKKSGGFTEADVDRVNNTPAGDLLKEIDTFSSGDTHDRKGAPF